MVLIEGISHFNCGVFCVSDDGFHHQLLRAFPLGELVGGSQKVASIFCCGKGDGLLQELREGDVLIR
jgi:hypothetical protein